MSRTNELRALAVGVARMVAATLLVTATLVVGIHGVSGELSGAVPAADFDYEHDVAAGTLTITHGGGEAIDAAALELAGVDAACAGGEWETGRVTRDDACVLEEVPAEGTVRIVWNGAGPTDAILDVWVASGR